MRIDTDATDGEVKKAYHRLARDLHPDVRDDSGRSAEEVKLVDLRFKHVTNSYNLIRAERGRS